MDGFYMFCGWSAILVFLGFCAGNFNTSGSMLTDCSTSGQVTLRNTVVECKPIAAIVDGRRITLVQPDDNTKPTPTNLR